MANHVSFDTIEKYLLESSYPPEIIGDKGGKVHFGRLLNFFCILDGHLMHKNLSSIISSKERQQIVVHDVPVSLGHDSKAKTMASDRGKDTFKPKILSDKKYSAIFTDITSKITSNDVSRSAIKASQKRES